MRDILSRINKEMLVHCMYDGFCIHSFKQKTLIISGSHDSIYMRDIDIVFKKVIFFNVPEKWRDTQITGDEMIRLATIEEFQKQHPGFDTGDYFIFAIDLHFYDVPHAGMHTYFIVAEHIYLNHCEPGNNNPVPEYVEKEESDFLSMKNKVRK